MDLYSACLKGIFFKSKSPPTFGSWQSNQMQKLLRYKSVNVTIFNFKKIFNLDHNNTKNWEWEMSKFILMLIQCLLLVMESPSMKKKGENFQVSILDEKRKEKISKCWCKGEKRSENYS